MGILARDKGAVKLTAPFKRRAGNPIASQL
jgi:hypothetical protein